MDTALGLLFVAVLALGTRVLVSFVGTRRRLARVPLGFRCRVRLRNGRVPGLLRSPEWGASSYAYWAHDVLLLHQGFTRRRTLALPVHFPEGAVRVRAHRAVPRLRGDVAVIELRLDDDTVVEVAAPASAYADLAGPFLAAAVQLRSGGKPVG